MVIQVDLNTRLLPDKTRAFLARPGKRSHYFDSFQKMGSIGPDLPFVSLQKQTPVEETPGLYLMLRRAQAYRRWRDGNPRVPFQDLDYYKTGPRVTRETAAQFRAILRGYFERARKGDLVLIPPGPWQSEAILAEFSTSRRNLRTVELLYFQDNVVNIPARSFRELTTIPKRLLPHHILEKVVKPNAFIQFDNYDTLKLQEIAYKSFIRRDEYNTEFRVTSEEHSLNENMQFVLFVKSIAANTQALAENRLKPYSLHDAISGDFEDFVPNLHANVNSPGWLRLVSHRNVPLLASIVYQLLVDVGREAADFAQRREISIRNYRPRGSTDERILEIERDAVAILQLLGLSNDLDEIHRIVINLHETAGLRSRIIVRKQHD